MVVDCLCDICSDCNRCFRWERIDCARCCRELSRECNEDGLYPNMNVCLALILLILNVIPVTAGWGTILSCLCSQYPLKSIIFGVLQFFLTIVLVGWLWSIWHGLRIYSATTSKNPFRD